MPPEDILALQSALIKLALNVYPSETGYVDQVLQNSFNIFEEDKCVIDIHCLLPLLQDKNFSGKVHTINLNLI